MLAELEIRYVKTNTLEIAYVEAGPSDGWPVVLTHGFPYDIHAYDEVAPILATAGARVIVPYVRGYGPTRFLDSATMRTGQQAALGSDLIDLLDALGIARAIVGGFDWGGLASCVASILAPERIAGLVSLASYDVIDIEQLKRPCHPRDELVTWYQHLFQHERGRQCLEANRRDLCRILWEQWSPAWKIDESRFKSASQAWENPDFVAVVVHAYRFSFGLAAGDPIFDKQERKLASRPQITVPAVTLDGTQDPLKPGGTASHANMFAARHEHRAIAAGHALPYEAPEAFADAILTVHNWQ